MSLAIGVGFTSCKGKTGPEGAQGPIGPTGPFGPGPTEYIYTGNFPADIGDYERHPVSIPEVNVDSDLLVHLSSNSVNWLRTPIYTLDFTNKTVAIEVGPNNKGWFYRVLVRNYP